MKIKMKNILLIIFISALGLQANAQGGLMIEPMLTYEDGDTTTDYPAPLSDSSGEVRGSGFGARLGAHFGEIFFIGLDGRFSTPEFKDSSVGYEATSESTNYGAVLGVQMPIVGLRLWGTGIFSGNLNPESSNGYDFKFDNASGYRLGVGFKFLLVSLNLEYQQIKYGTATLEQAGAFTPGTVFDDVELENKSWIGSVSFPLQF